MNPLTIMGEFPAEIFGLSLTVLIYVLRVMNKRCVTVTDLMRAERKLAVVIQRNSDAQRDRTDEMREALRAEFDRKLQDLRNELGGY